MSRYLHTLSAVLFYVVAGSFFVCYVMVRNELGGDWPVLWLKIGDLPLLLLGLLYGGLSIYRSLTDTHSSGLLVAILVPLAALFALGAIANFWPVIGG